MLILAFDTSASSVSVAVLDEARVWSYQEREMERGHAEALMPMIQSVLDASRITLKDIGGVAVSLGPGSFTGVRVGLAAARAFALALNIRVYGVTTFEAWAYHVGKPAWVVLDTKRDDYYAQLFDGEGKVSSEPTILSAEQFKEKLPFDALGTGAEKLASEVHCGLIQKISPIAVSIGRVALGRLDHPLPPDPIYLREADVTL